ncbi:binding-protein-dependent transport systems inner membrane component (plasmid) [Rhizobium leguminosarum bv. trifolii WSM2304]|uniref:Binding-protein-dependent transport systems inner membrane component n=1 Tax=Rhizobium leguminosarum bv. trifolii (strain WSM2304) TaxID=395492 RepID=A0ABF7QZ92_RHILW|nr:carbohydrate ABC transporter permease [Rhizobium leguminosarum]ACI59482.1 binding-protein-dependent transport systems inner membrane component [Rhizobium leguminosarum bv. trifolii WSM2304]
MSNDANLPVPVLLKDTSERPSVFFQALALLVTALYAVPMLYVVLVALTPDGEWVGAWPSHFEFSNFSRAFFSSNFVRFFFNSAIVAVACTILQVLLSCAAGYALAMLPMHGRNLMMLLLVALLVVPPEVSIVPLFVMVSHVPLAGGNDILGMGGQGLMNTLPGIMVPHIVSALAIFLMRQFYISLPEELGDAARMDGAGEFRIFFEVYTPLVKPAVAVVGVFAFQSAWNDFIWPLVTTSSNDLRTLQLGLTVFFQENSTQWNLLMAAVLTISVPILMLFLLIQRYFQTGALSGAIK